MGIKPEARELPAVESTINGVVRAFAADDSILRSVIEALPAALYVTDSHGNITHFNRACVDFSGRVPEIGSDKWCVTFKLFWPDGRPLPHEECPMAQALQRGRPIRGIEAIAERPDGTRIPFLPFPTPLFDEDGKLVGAVNLLVDLSTIKNAEARASESEEALRLSEARLRLAQETARVGTFEWDMISGVNTWTPELEALYGLAPGTFPGTQEDFEKLVHPDDVQKLRSQFEIGLSAGRPIEGEWRCIWPDGSVHWIAGRWQALCDAQGHPTRVTGINIDITERKVAETALANKQIELDLIARTTPVRLTRCSRDLRYLYVNQATADLFGVAPEEMVGKSIPEMVGAETFAKIKPYIDQVLSGMPVDYEAEVSYPQVGNRWVRISYVPERNADDDVVGWVASIIDITDRKRSEDALSRQLRQLRNIYNISAKLGATSDVEQIIKAALDGLISAVEADRASVLLFEEDGVMRFKGWRRLSKAYRDAVEGHSPWTPDDADAKPIVVGDVMLDEGLAPFRETFNQEGVRALGFIPLVAGKKVLGKFMVYYDQVHDFTESEIQVCETIAGHVTYAIEKARSEEALRKSEERFRLATASGLVGVWDWKVESNVVEWSDTTYDIHGVKKEEFDGTVEAFAQLVHEEDRTRVETAIRESLEKDVPYEMEFRVVQPRGRTVWLYTHAKVLRDDAGRPVRMLGGTLDITERKNAELALVDSEARARALSDRLRALLNMTSHLIETLETGELLETILDLSRQLVDADAFGVWRRNEEGKWALVAQRGLSEKFLSESLSADRYAALPTEPIIVQPEDMAHHSTQLLSERWRRYEEEGIHSLMILPLRIHGEIGGTLVFYCRKPHVFSEIEVESATTMANISAAALTTAELYEAQAQLRHRAEEDAVRETFLSATSGILSGSLDFEETLVNVVQAAVPSFADWAAVDLLDEEGHLRRLAVAHVDPEKVALAHELHEKYPPHQDANVGVLHVIETGEPEMMREIPDELIESAARDEEHAVLIRQLQLKSYISVPLKIRGEVTGAISFVGAESGRLFDEKDLSVANEIAHRSSQAMERALLYKDLRTSEEKFRSIFEKSTVGKAVFSTKDALIERANESLCQLLGFEQQELEDSNLFHLIHRDDRAVFSELLRRAAEDTSTAIRCEVRLTTKSGDTAWAIASATVLHGSAGQAIIALHDITDRKIAEEQLVVEAQTLATLNKTGATVAAETNLDRLIQTVTDAGTELAGAKFGAFFYNSVNETGESYLLYSLSGAPKEAFEKFGVPRKTDIFATTFDGEGVVRCDDVTKDPRYGRNAPHQGMPEGHLPVKSYLAVPVVSRSGQVIGGLFFGHPDAGVFTERTERVISGIAAQSAIAIDNAKLYEALSASEKQVRLITDSLPVLISYVDCEERYRFNSATYEKWFGKTREEIVGKTLGEVLGDAAREKLDPYVKRVLAGERVDFEARVPYAGTHPRHVAVSYVPDFDDDGGVKGFFAMVEDISSRVKAERSARRSDERLRQACDAAEMGVWSVDLSTHTSTRDGGFNRILGLGSLESNQPFDDIAELIHPEDRPNWRKAWDMVFDNRAPYDVEFRIIRPDGSVRWLRELGRFVRAEEGESDYIAGVALDITVRRDLDSERLRASKLESIGVLAGGIAHDFNNILTAILGNVALANMHLEPGSKAAERISAAESACQRAQRLTHQLLTFSKGGQPIKTVFSIREVVEESAGFVLQGSNVQIVPLMPSDLPFVEADSGQIGQVVQNLVINAAQSMPGGGDILIKARAVSVAGDHSPLKKGRYVEVSVIDSGCGIATSHQSRVFDPFFTTKDKGSGLGLTTCYSIMQRHGGHLEFDSELGKGTTFRFYLPASQEAATVMPEQKESSVSGSSRVLVMDDEDSVCDIAKIGLGGFGYDVATASSGTEAVALYRAAMKDGRPFDVVVLDLTVRGDMGGKEALEKIREFDPNVKAIVASGFSNDPVLANFREFGFSGMIAKPFRMADLARNITEVLS